MAGPGDVVQVAMSRDGMRVASLGKQLRRSAAARLKGAHRQTLTECCVVRCEVPYGLWTGGITDVTHAQNHDGLSPGRAVVPGAARHGCRARDCEEPRSFQRPGAG